MYWISGSRMHSCVCGGDDGCSADWLRERVRLWIRMRVKSRDACISNSSSSSSRDTGISMKGNVHIRPVWIHETGRRSTLILNISPRQSIEEHHHLLVGGRAVGNGSAVPWSSVGKMRVVVLGPVGDGTWHVGGPSARHCRRRRGGSGRRR